MNSVCHIDVDYRVVCSYILVIINENNNNKKKKSLCKKKLTQTIPV